MTTQRANYRGFSTKTYEETGYGFGLYDVELVNQDLINEIFTVQGDRVGMPTYGTRIPTMTFELNDELSQSIIRNDLLTVFSHDPRVRVDDLQMISQTDQNALTFIAKLFYVEFFVSKDLYITVQSQ
jgi:phage baseplate assembly protein W